MLLFVNVAICQCCYLLMLLFVNVAICTDIKTDVKIVPQFCFPRTVTMQSVTKHISCAVPAAGRTATL